MNNFSIFFKKIYKLILNFIFPNFCVQCNKLLMYNNEILCNGCLDLLKKEITFQSINSSGNKEIQHIDFCFYYRSEVFRNVFINGKFGLSKKSLKIIAEVVKPIFRLYLKEDNIFIPVPISKIRKYQRGFNQCEVLLKSILPDEIIFTNILKKIKHNASQTTLTVSERKNNPMNCYEIANKININGKNIVLFDDVCTTGSTLEECAIVLKAAGVKRITALTLAITKGDFN